MGRDSMFRFGLAAISIIVVLGLITPVFSRVDGFPVSTQPVYASLRDTTAEFVTAQGRTVSGDIVALPIRVVADTDDPLIAQSRMNRVAETGASAEHCELVAVRAQDVSARSSALVSIEVVSVRHDIGETAAGRDGLVDSVVLASCAIPELADQ